MQNEMPPKQTTLNVSLSARLKLAHTKRIDDTLNLE